MSPSDCYNRIFKCSIRVSTTTYLESVLVCTCCSGQCAIVRCYFKPCRVYYLATTQVITVTASVL